MHCENGVIVFVSRSGGVGAGKVTARSGLNTHLAINLWERQVEVWRDLRVSAIRACDARSVVWSGSEGGDADASTRGCLSPRPAAAQTGLEHVRNTSQSVAALSCLRPGERYST